MHYYFNGRSALCALFCFISVSFLYSYNTIEKPQSSLEILILQQNCSGNCPEGFTLFACGRCWQDEDQAKRGGCNETCATPEINQSAFKTHTIPGLIQAEDYDNGGQDIAYNDTTNGNSGNQGRNNEAVDIEFTNDTGGGTNVGWIANGEWLEYTIATTKSGNYDVAFRVSSISNASKSIKAYLGTQYLGEAAIGNTSNWQNFTTITLENIQINTTSKNQVLRLEMIGEFFNINWVRFIQNETTPPPTSNQTAYRPHTIPGLVEAENYDNGGPGIAYKDTTNGNSGNQGRTSENVDIQTTIDTGDGTNVGWIANGEWLEYTIGSVKPSTYTIDFRVASVQNTSKSISVSLDNTSLGSVSIPNTNGWQSFQTVSLTNIQITNSNANQILRLAMVGGAFNINWIQFKEQTTPKPPTPPTNGNLAFLEPSNGKKMLFIGQDLLSASDYIADCARCPTPTGITTYLNLGALLQNGSNGALGWSTSKQPTRIDTDWGAGPLNAYSSAVGFSDSAVAIGLYMVNQLNAINAGQLDGQIGHLADFFNELNDTAFYLRIGYEFDGNWNGYDSAAYVKAYRYIVDILRNKGVNNVAYVWQSSTSPIDDILDGGQENLEAYYPGDNYVDWFGMSWFLRPNEKAIANTITTQKELGDELIALAKTKGKPVMIAEAANQGYDNQKLNTRHISSIWDGNSGQGQNNKTANQIWNEWYTPFFNFIDNNPSIKAVCYINADWDAQSLWAPPYSQGYWGDTRIQVNETIENNWVNEITTNNWQPGSNDLNSILGLTAGRKIATSFTENTEIKIYPNPSTDGVITVSGLTVGTLTIYDVKGQLINEIPIATEATTVRIPFIEKGIFFVKINSELGAPVTKKLVIL